MQINKTFIVCGAVAFAGTVTTQAAEKPAPATQLLATAKVRANKEHKTVMVVFHASWCGWCHRLSDVMDKAPFKKLFSDNYVIVPLDVSEHGDKKALENPGADKVMADLGGARSGLPFYVVLDAKGAKLATSKAVPGANGTSENIGYPTTNEEISAFDSLLQKTAPKMNVAARKNFIAYLKKTARQ